MGPETYSRSSGARLGRLPQGGTNELADTPSAMESGGRGRAVIKARDYQLLGSSFGFCLQHNTFIFNTL